MNCGGCKYFAQGKNSSYCEHPEQTNEDRKSYCYYTHGCNLKEKGISQSRIDFMMTGILPDEKLITEQKNNSKMKNKIKEPTSNLKAWWNNLNFKAKFYVFTTTCVMLLPYISIQYYKYQGNTSIGCLKWNIQIGFIYCAFQFTTEWRKDPLSQLQLDIRNNCKVHG